MTTNNHASKIVELGVALDEAAAEGRTLETLQPIIDELGTTFADHLGACMAAGHRELQPPRSAAAAVADFDAAFADRQAHKLGSAIRTAVLRSPEVGFPEAMQAETLVVDLVRNRLTALFDAASGVAGRA